MLFSAEDFRWMLERCAVAVPAALQEQKIPLTCSGTSTMLQIYRSVSNNPPLIAVFCSPQGLLLLPLLQNCDLC